MNENTRKFIEKENDYLFSQLVQAAQSRGIVLYKTCPYCGSDNFYFDGTEEYYCSDCELGWIATNDEDENNG